jgi:hypothetical protein
LIVIQLVDRYQDVHLLERVTSSKSDETPPPFQIPRG